MSARGLRQVTDNWFWFTSCEWWVMGVYVKSLKSDLGLRRLTDEWWGFYVDLLMSDGGFTSCDLWVMGCLRESLTSDLEFMLSEWRVIWGLLWVADEWFNITSQVWWLVQVVDNRTCILRTSLNITKKRRCNLSIFQIIIIPGDWSPHILVSWMEAKKTSQQIVS